MRYAIAASLVLLPLALQAQTNDWPSYNRTLNGQRFAPQTEITPANAANLKELCRYDLKTPSSFQTGPIVLNGIMYLTTAHDTIAIDAETCAEKWRAHEDYAMAIPNDTNRGAAFSNGLIIRGTQDARLLAYSAATGKKVWDIAIGDPKRLETTSAAVLAWKGMVYTGNAGSAKMPTKGRMYGIDALTGHIVWEQYMVPRSADDKPRGPAAPEPKVKGTATEGGTPWTAFTLDEATGTLYVPGGNPSSATEASFTVALDAKTGTIKDTYLPVAHDFHDWEVSAAPLLFRESPPDGNQGKGQFLTNLTLVEAAKDGRIYSTSDLGGNFLLRASDATAPPASSRITKPTWTANATTVRNETAPLTAAGTHVCPGTVGGNEWSNPAYSSSTKLLYNGAVDWCATLTSTSTAQPKVTFDDPKQATGWIKAFTTRGKEAWSFHAPAPVLAGLTPTAGNLLFAGDLAGNLYAFNATTGAVIWKTNTGGAIGGSVISYAIAGKQRIAVTSGMKSNVWPMASGSPSIVIYGLKTPGTHTRQSAHSSVTQ